MGIYVCREFIKKGTGKFLNISNETGEDSPSFHSISKIKYFNYIPTFWLTDNYPKSILFNVDFQKKGSEWEIISMKEI